MNEFIAIFFCITYIAAAWATRELYYESFDPKGWFDHVIGCLLIIYWPVLIVLLVKVLIKNHWGIK